MMRKHWARGLLVAAILVGLCSSPAMAGPVEHIPADSRCQVCGMFVARFPNWLTQVRLDDGSVRFFDGVKDLMAYRFDPAAYGGSRANGIREIWVRDYYTLGWIDGRRAFYVVGSDVHGPMGQELIPFADQQAARTFLRDHHGQRLVSFAEVDRSLIQQLRHGQRMRH